RDRPRQRLSLRAERPRLRPPDGLALARTADPDPHRPRPSLRPCRSGADAASWRQGRPRGGTRHRLPGAAARPRSLTCRRWGAWHYPDRGIAAAGPGRTLAATTASARGTPWTHRLRSAAA